MDVPLLNFGHCNYISSKHAVIFYDEVKFVRKTEKIQSCLGS